MTELGVGVWGTEVTAAEREERFSAFVASHRERARRLAWRLVGGDEAAAEDAWAHTLAFLQEHLW